MKRCPRYRRVYAEFVESCPLCKEKLSAAWKKPENITNMCSKNVYSVRFRVEVDAPTNFAISYAGPILARRLPETPPCMTIEL